MKAPEKIYLTEDNPLKEWYRAKQVGFDSIEYTRTDAFIEKACNAYCKVCGHYPHTVPTHICRKNCDYFSDFKNYMKGE